MSHTYNEAQLTTFLDHIAWRLRLIEAQFALMALELGKPHHDAASMTPAEIIDLLIRATNCSHTPRNPTVPCQHPPRTSTFAVAAA
jgi:hypothetical protein